MGVVDFQSGLQGELMRRAVAQFQREKFEEDKRQAFNREGMQQQVFESNEELKRAQLDATADARRQATETQRIGQAQSLADQIPSGQFIAENDPAVGMLRTGGRGAMLQPQDERPRVDEGPLMPGDTGAAKAKGFIKTASSTQRTAQEAADAKVEAARVAADNRENENSQRAKDRLVQIQAAAAARPKTDKLTKVEHRDPATGRTVIEYLPESEVRGKSYEKGTGAAAEGRLASAQAVNQTGDDIIAQIANPTVAAMLGPEMGRYNSLRDFIGNPPPELSELAGAIESYAIANMGVHGMRSAAGAAEIKKLLDKRHTPESLTSTIRGLSRFSQHFMENEGRGKSGAGPNADAGGGDAADPLGLRKK